MARIRTIKPDLASSKDIAKLSLPARYFFAILLCELDDEGRMEYSPKKLSGALYPHDDGVESSGIREWVTECCTATLLIRYRVGDNEYLCAPKFLLHQRVNRPTPSSNPLPTEADAEIIQGALPELLILTPEQFDEYSVRIQGALSPGKREIGNRKREKGKGSAEGRSTHSTGPLPEPPSLADCKEYALARFNLNGTFAERFHSKNSERNWCDSQGRPYQNWKNLMAAWVAKMSPIERDQVNGGSTPKPPAAKPDNSMVHR